MSTEPNDDPFAARYNTIDQCVEDIATHIRTAKEIDPASRLVISSLTTLLQLGIVALTDIAQAQTVIAQIVANQDKEARAEAAAANNPHARKIIGKPSKGPFTPPD